MKINIDEILYNIDIEIDIKNVFIELFKHIKIEIFNKEIFYRLEALQHFCHELLVEIFTLLIQFLSMKDKSFNVVMEFIYRTRFKELLDGVIIH